MNLEATIDEIDAAGARGLSYLREGKRVVATYGSKSRVTGFLAGLNAAEESIVSSVQSPQDVLQNLGVDESNIWALAFHADQFRLLLCTRNGNSAPLEGVTLLLESGVV